MLNIAAPEKFVLTLQSIPPFLIESILAFALAVLLAVPLIARIHLLFDNRGNHSKPFDPINTRGRRLNRRNRHIIIHYPSPMVTTSRSSQSLQLHSMRVNNSSCDIKQSLETLTSIPLTDQSQDQPGDETEEEKGENDEDTMSDDNQIMNCSHYEYQHYRHKLIKEHLKKNYGHFQAPGNVVLNAIHLSSIDSQRGMKYSDKYNHTLLNSINLSDTNDNAYDHRCLGYPKLRDYFLTREINGNFETMDRGMETVHSSIELDKSPIVSSDKERANTPTGSSRKQRPHCGKKEKLSNDDSDSANAVKCKNETIDTNSRPNSSRKLITKSLNRPVTPRNSPIAKKPVGIGGSVESSLLPTNAHVGKSLDTSDPTQEELNELGNSSYITKVPVAAAAEIAPVVEKPDRPPSHVASIVGKCSSMASSEAFSTCSSKNPERRLMNARPGSSSGGGGSGSLRTFRNLTSRVNSRPRSSGATFAWDKPNIPGKVPSYEEPTETENLTSNTKRPRSGITSVNRKKSEVLSVLESIIDLSCDATIDFQESTDDMVIRNFREMSDDIVSSKGIERKTYSQRGGKLRPSGNIKKPKSPVLSNQEKTRTNTNSTNENKAYLRSRSGNYSRYSNVGHSRKNNNN